MKPQKIKQKNIQPLLLDDNQKQNEKVQIKWGQIFVTLKGKGVNVLSVQEVSTDKENDPYFNRKTGRRIKKCKFTKKDNNQPIKTKMFSFINNF